MDQLVSLLEAQHAQRQAIWDEEAELAAKQKAFNAACRRSQRGLETRRHETQDNIAALEEELHEANIQKRKEQDAVESGKFNVTFLIFRFFLLNCCFLFCSPSISGLCPLQELVTP